MILAFVRYTPSFPILSLVLHSVPFDVVVLVQMQMFSRTFLSWLLVLFPSAFVSYQKEALVPTSLFSFCFL